MRAKTEGYSDKHLKVALFAKAMSHPVRVAIVTHLMEVGEASCGAIVNTMPLAQPTISRHLKELRETGVVDQRIEGTHFLYSVNYDNINLFCNVFRETLHPGEPMGAA